MILFNEAMVQTGRLCNKEEQLPIREITSALIMTSHKGRLTCLRIHLILNK